MLKVLRRRKDTHAAPETTTPALPEDAGPTVVMRFCTQGGAPIELYEHSWTRRLYHTEGAPPEERPESGYNWRCTGCDTVGRDSYSGGYVEHRPSISKQDANAHAAGCHSMPRLHAA